jgi:hypothetical protein
MLLVDGQLGMTWLIHPEYLLALVQAPLLVPPGVELPLSADHNFSACTLFLTHAIV